MEGLTKEKLNQLSDLREEISELEKQISRIQQKVIGTTMDKVKASFHEFPYIEGNVLISGFDSIALERRDSLVRNKIQLLNARKIKAQELENEITEYINSISESRIRRIMQYRYVDNLTWAEVGELVHCDRTTAEKIVSRYLEENS